jgi:arylsulfatase A-like enzyme
MDRRQFVSLLGATALPAQVAARKPNIVFILADDLGYGDVGCYGQEQIATPNLDRMAAEGVRFTDAYAGDTVCAPSRCCLITGMHSGRGRIRGNSPTVPLRPEDNTVSEVLKKAGYENGLIGKWSLGELGTTGYPTLRGFDEWFGYFSQTQAHNYYPELLLENNHAVLFKGNSGTQKQDYSHDLFTQRALRFLEKRRAQPFFLHLSYTIPHTNNELARDTGNGMEVPTDAPYSNRSWPQTEKNFAAMITRMDADVGKLLARLKELGIDKDTIVFFSSDNGPHKAGGHDANFFDSNGPLRGIKGDLYEGGIRVPTMVWWPGRVQPGRVSRYPWAFWDFLPTAAEIAGVKPPPCDGISVLPEILGKPQPDRPYLYWELHAGKRYLQAARMGDWKGVRLGPGKPLEVYNLKGDLGETKNLAATRPEVVAKLESILAAAHTDSKDFPAPRPS